MCKSENVLKHFVNLLFLFFSRSGLGRNYQPWLCNPPKVPTKGRFHRGKLRVARRNSSYFLRRTRNERFVIIRLGDLAVRVRERRFLLSSAKPSPTALEADSHGSNGIKWEAAPTDPDYEINKHGDNL